GAVTNAPVTGTLNVLSAAHLIAGANGIELGHRPTATSAIAGNLNINGGTVTMGGDIVVGGGTGNLTLNGTLDLAGHNINVNGGTFNLNGSGTHPVTGTLNANAGTANLQTNPGSDTAYTLS